MSAAIQILEYELSDAARSRWLAAYSLILFVMTYALFTLSGELDKVLLSLSSFMLLVVPLTSSIFGALHVYSSQEFVEMLLTQPVSRKSVFRALYWGVALPLSASFVLGAGAPLIAFTWGSYPDTLSVLLLLTLGVSLTLVFSAAAVMVALATDDKAKGLGAAIVVWLALCVLYDGAVLTLALLFRDYPLEAPLLAVSILNPVDLARCMMLLELDGAAMMGYTGAALHRALGNAGGLAVCATVMTAWFAAAYLSAARLFARRDF